MLCSRFLRSIARGQARLVLSRHRALLRRHAARLRLTPAVGAAHPSGHHGASRRGAGGDRCTCSSTSQGLHPRPGHRPDSGLSPRPPQGTSFYQMVEYEKQIAEIVCGQSECGSAHVERRRSPASTLGGPNFGQLLVHLKPRHERELSVDEVIKSCGRKLAAIPGHEGLSAESADRPDRRQGDQESLPVLHAVAGQDGACTRRPEHWTKKVAELPGVEDVTSDVADRDARRSI